MLPSSMRLDGAMAQDPQSSAAKWSPKSRKTPLEQGEA